MSNKKKEQLGMNPGTAYNRLRKMLLWKYIVAAGDNMCYRCGELIGDIDDLSVEHIVPWLDSDDPIDAFFNLKNIAFRHLSCNSAHKRYPDQYTDT